MKKIVFITFSVIVCLCSARAQGQDLVGNLGSISSDTGNFTIERLITMLQSSSNIEPVVSEPPTYPLGRGLFKKHHVEQAIEVSPSISRDKVNQSDLLSGQNLENFENTENTGFSIDFGYSVIFIPGYEEDSKLFLNKAGFAYSLGLIASFTRNDRYGTTCNVLLKAGIETCYNKKMGIGLDLMGGYGKSPGDIFWYKNIAEDTAPTLITPYTLWGWEYGGQLWLKTTTINKSDIIIFARLIMSPDPGEIQKFSAISYNLWKEESWSFGIIIRYKL